MSGTDSAGRFNILSQMEHLQSKYMGTGHADTTKFEWATHHIWILQLCVEIILLQLINVVTVFVTTNSLKVVTMEYFTVTSYNGDCYEF